MKHLKNYRFEPCNMSKGINARLSLVRMGANVEILSVSVRYSKDEKYENLEFVVSVREDECALKDGEVYDIIVVPVWKNMEEHTYNTIDDRYVFLNHIQLENEAYNVFYRRIG